MSFIAMEYFQRSPVLALPLIALALFMFVFFAVTLRTVLTRKDAYDAISNLPLQDETPNGRANPEDTKEARRGE